MCLPRSFKKTLLKYSKLCMESKEASKAGRMKKAFTWQGILCCNGPFLFSMNF